MRPENKFLLEKRKINKLFVKCRISLFFKYDDIHIINNYIGRDIQFSFFFVPFD